MISFTASEPINIHEACRTPAYAMVLEQLVEKAHAEDLIADLGKDGHDQTEAARIVEHGKLLLREAARSKTAGSPMVGILILLLGGGITIFTLVSALDVGGTVLICYGAL